MPTPKWTINRLTRCINNIQEVMAEIKEREPEAYKKLNHVNQSLTGLIVMLKKGAK